MTFLTKKKQKRMMRDVLELYTIGSEALKAIGTSQADKIDPVQAMQRQLRMTESAMNIAYNLRGMYGMHLIMAIEKRKQEIEERIGCRDKLIKTEMED